ncbi:MAG: VPLPA-CTERM sorting domain-containing protein [Pseudomonadota bacterium]
MKRLLIIACVVMMALCVSGTASAAYFDVTENYSGTQQSVGTGNGYFFIFDFWQPNPTPTTDSSLSLSPDASMPYATKFFYEDSTGTMRSYFSFAYSGAGKGAEATINFFAGNGTTALWSNSQDMLGSGIFTHYFTQKELDTLDNFGWGKITILNAATSKTFKIDSATMNVVATPIPSAVWLLGSGLIGIVAIRRRFNK